MLHWLQTAWRHWRDRTRKGQIERALYQPDGGTDLYVPDSGKGLRIKDDSGDLTGLGGGGGGS